MCALNFVLQFVHERGGEKRSTAHENADGATVNSSVQRSSSCFSRAVVSAPFSYFHNTNNNIMRTNQHYLLDQLQHQELKKLLRKRSMYVFIHISSFQSRHIKMLKWLGSIRFFLLRSLFCSGRLHLFDQKYRKIVILLSV